jgi:hypothetical protein
MFNRHIDRLPRLTEADEATYTAGMFEIALQNLPANFPVRLTNALECSYKSAFLTHMNSMHNSIQTNPDSKESFSIMTASCNQRFAEEFKFLTHETGLTSVILANHELLKWYRRSRHSYITNFREIASEDGVENPQLNQVLSLGVCDMGWSFDTHGCLSFYRCQKVWDMTIRYIVYVKRDNPEKQPDHEVGVME